MKAEDLINWKELSRTLATHPETIRRTYSGKKYKTQVEELKETINEWITKHINVKPEQHPDNKKTD